ncbi:unnamed protein product [Mytilus coruscus]|uniref:Uncharacterized protein n=1 Tax=Mytilus coruscus TaxID=42192 RepID=A0A6J8BXT1_MYTCO|nr:unnamed protein product [Mytilus coruscus]
MPQTLIQGITGGIDTHTPNATVCRKVCIPEAVGTSKSYSTSEAGTSKSYSTTEAGTSKSYSKEVTQLSLLEKAKEMSVEIQQFLQDYRTSKLLPKKGDMFTNYVDATKGITEDERDELTSFLCSFKEINVSVIDVPTMVPDTISFIVHHSDKTVNEEVNYDLIAIGLAAEPTEEATFCNQLAEVRKLQKLNIVIPYSDITVATAVLEDIKTAVKASKMKRTNESLKGMYTIIASVSGESVTEKKCRKRLAMKIDIPVRRISGGRRIRYNPAYFDIIISQERLAALPIGDELSDIQTVDYQVKTVHISDNGSVPDQTDPSEIKGNTHSSVILPDPHIDIRKKVGDIVSDVVGQAHGDVTTNKKAFGVTTYWYRQEFAKSRGMVHWHDLCWRSDREPQNLINDCIEKGLSDAECAATLSDWASIHFS